MREKGFTLIELIVVLTIIVLLSSTGYKATLMALNLQQNVKTGSQSLREFQLGLFILSSDFNQIQQKPIPDDGGIFQSGNDHVDLFSFYLSPDSNIPSGVRFVNYRFEDRSLTQVLWVNQEKYETKLIHNISDIEVSYYDDNYKEHHIWQDESYLPSRIKIKITHDRYSTFIFEKELVSI